MKTIALILIFLSVSAIANPYFVPVGIKCGVEIPLDGTDQEFFLSYNQIVKAFQNRPVSEPILLFVKVLGAGGAQVSNEAIVAGTYVFPQNEKVPISILNTTQNIHVKGVNGEKIVITY